MNQITHIGLDVHKETIAVAVASRKNCNKAGDTEPKEILAHVMRFCKRAPSGRLSSGRTEMWG